MNQSVVPFDYGISAVQWSGSRREVDRHLDVIFAAQRAQSRDPAEDKQWSHAGVLRFDDIYNAR